MDIFKERFGTNVAFVMASDDIQWCKSTFQDRSDVFYSPFTKKEQDIAVLNQCDHAISR